MALCLASLDPRDLGQTEPFEMTQAPSHIDHAHGMPPSPSPHKAIRNEIRNYMTGRVHSKSLSSLYLYPFPRRV